MATIDLSRHATNFAKHFDSARMQQGRVLTDDDFNEHARLHAEDIRKTRVHVIGPTGSPDQGFLIESPQVTNGKLSFRIKAGTFYLGGLRLALETDEFYHLQKDWLQQGENAADRLTAPTTAQRYDLVYLEAWRQPVSAVEDNELFEVGLGGPDTSARVRTMRRVRVRQGVADAGCDTAFATLLNDWAAQGILNEESEFVSDARLTAGPDGTTGPADLCSPPVAGGYLGAENQAIRVQLVSSNQFTWGFDNAAPLYRVQVSTDSNGVRRRIIMLTEPKDQAHWPLSGQVVELLPWSAALVNNQKLSELRGHLTKVNGTYNPDTKEFFVTSQPPGPGGLPPQPFGEHWRDRNDPGAGDAAVLDDEGEFFYLRVWNRGSDTTSPAKITFVPGNPVSLGHTGLQITFTGTQFRPDDFWIIAARPDSPNLLVPWDFATARPPHGVRRWVTPLAVIQWRPQPELTGVVVHDCRHPFRPLTRQETCCTYRVGDGILSHGDFTSIQNAVDALPIEGGQVCVLPGEFRENVVITKRHDITITGCGPRSRIVSRPPTTGTIAAPVIQVLGGRNITIDSLAVEAHTSGVGILLEGINPDFIDSAANLPLSNVTLFQLLVSAAGKNAIRAQFVDHLTIRECEVQMQDTVCLDHAVFALGDDMLIERNVVETVILVPDPDLEGPAFGGLIFSPGSRSRGGIQIGGTSDRVRIINNLIRGGSGDGITLGSLIFIDPNKQPVPPENWPASPPVDPCDPAKPADSTIDLRAFPQNSPMRPASAGTLTEIVVERNRIYDMGMNGIGVVKFFNLDAADEFISVEMLSILGNDIRRCLLRPLADIDNKMIDSAGYGGISLADVERLVIRDNLIADNGPNYVEPVCGIFILHAEGMEISRNRILNNGARPIDRQIPPKIGRRGGINIVYAITPMTPLQVGDRTYPGQNGEPALKIEGNVVSVPLGQALRVTALGPVSVVANEFTSRGIMPTGPAANFVPATVEIVDLGLSNEIYWQFLQFASLAGNAGAAGSADAPTPRSGLDDQRLGAFMANGNVLFTNNQCVLDVFEGGVSLAVTSISIVSLDDIGFHGNQCDSSLAPFEDFILSQVFLFGTSVRAHDNRLKESFYGAFFSAITFGIMNMTTHNQTTHCLLIRSFPHAPFQLMPPVNAPNTILLDAYAKGFCTRFAQIKRDPTPNNVAVTPTAENPAPEET